MNEHHSTFLLEGAEEVMSVGSTDAARAAMRMVRASADVAKAELIHMFEKAQSDLVKELVRLKNNDLVTYHIDAAMARVKVILDPEPKILPSGKRLGGRLRQATA